MMDRETLSMLADAISDVGSWWCWQAEGDAGLLEFCDVQLDDASNSEHEPRSTDVLAVRFRGHAFAVLVDNLDEEGWQERFRDDDALLYPIDWGALAFDDTEATASLMADYRNRLALGGFDGLDTLSSAQHLLCGRCGDVGFVAGGDVVDVIGGKGKYTAEEIEASAAKWGTYWKAYWQLRGTADAYPEDYVCEVTIPISGD